MGMRRWESIVVVWGLLSGCSGGSPSILLVSLSSFNFSNISQGSVCSSAATSITCTAPDGSAYGSITIDMGSDFLASNILLGKTVFGVSGSIAIGSNVAGTNGSLSISIPAGYYDGTKTATAADSSLTGSKIVSGSTIFGVSGIVPQLASTASRDVNTTQLTQLQEATTYAGATLPAGYRDVPDVTKDDDGYDNSSSPVVKVVRTSFSDCGTSQSTIASRIAHCAAKIGADATWDGAIKGTAGQGLWKLVTRNGASKEVWQDQRTGLLWSSKSVTDSEWCKASGNQQNHVSGNCSSISTSYCAEVSPLTSAFGDETWATPTYAPAKGGMGANSTPSVRWRLPTIYDYKLADVNGIRFVMPDMGASGSVEWSASLVSHDRSGAWSFDSSDGAVNLDLRSSTYSVRCVAR